MRLWYKFGLAEVLLAMLLVGPFFTAETNTDPVAYAAITLPPETHYDAVSAILARFIFLLPFFLGRDLLQSPADSERIMRVLVVAGLIYSLPMLFEIRMSPQLHTWVYGYFPAVFGQQAREGGFRPVVFLGHGLAVAFFIMTATVAATALWRAGATVLRLPAAAATGYLAGMLLLCRSLASLTYGALLAPMVRLTNPRTQMRVAVLFAVIVFSYPLFRAADLVPTNMMIDAARSIDIDRANSLKVRLDQEQILLNHASKRILFGWGNSEEIEPTMRRPVEITPSRMATGS